MDFTKFTIKSQEALQKAHILTEQNGNQTIELGHVLKAIFEEDKDITPYLLQKLEVNQKMLELALDKIIESYPKVSGGQIYLSAAAQKTLNTALEEMKQLGDEYVSIEMLLYSMLETNDSIGRLLKDNNITKNNLRDNGVLVY